LGPGRSAQLGAVPQVFRCLDCSDMAVHRRQPAGPWSRRANGRTASIRCLDGARRSPSPWSTGRTIITFQLGKVRSDDWAAGWSSRGWFSDGPTMTGVPRPIASATIDNARLSATPCASLLAELKLHGANSTTPRGGRERMARSKSAHERSPIPRGPESAPGGLTARQSDGDVAHRGISFGSVPVALTRLDVSDVTDLDLEPLGFCGDPSAARGDD
jgi:hypothetical protein